MIIKLESTVAAARREEAVVGVMIALRSQTSVLNMPFPERVRIMYVPPLSSEDFTAPGRCLESIPTPGNRGAISAVGQTDEDFRKIMV
jgi:hypothetical protein